MCNDFTEQDEIEFLAWIRKQKSCISGKYPVQACHVRRVAYGAGTGIKPRLFAVPMTPEEHHIQTVNGEAACLNKFLPFRIMPFGMFDARMAKDWFEQQALKYRAAFLAHKKATK